MFFARPLGIILAVFSLTEGFRLSLRHDHFNIYREVHISASSPYDTYAVHGGWKAKPNLLKEVIAQPDTVPPTSAQVEGDAKSLDDSTSSAGVLQKKIEHVKTYSPYKSTEQQRQSESTPKPQKDSNVQKTMDADASFTSMAENLVPKVENESLKNLEPKYENRSEGSETEVVKPRLRASKLRALLHHTVSQLFKILISLVLMRIFAANMLQA
jgi:hypothetical protein